MLPLKALPLALAHIHSGTIANLVHADRRDKGTLVSHQVFLIKKSDGWYVRHAALGKAVEDDPIDILGRYRDLRWRLIGSISTRSTSRRLGPRRGPRLGPCLGRLRARPTPVPLWAMSGRTPCVGMSKHETQATQRFAGPAPRRGTECPQEHIGSPDRPANSDGAI